MAVVGVRLEGMGMRAPERVLTINGDGRGEHFITAPRWAPNVRT